MRLGLGRLALFVLFVSACANPAPSATPTNPPTPSPTPLLTPSAGPTQANFIGGAGAWANEFSRIYGPLTASVYVDTRLTQNGTESWFSETEPGSGGEGGDFGTELSEASRDALVEALAGREVEFVDDPLTVTDQEAPDVMGCRRYLGGRAMLHFSPPQPTGSATTFWIAVNIDRGCQGTFHLLELQPDADGLYRVVRVVREGSWIV